MKMETATQRMRYDLLLKLYGKAHGESAKMQIYPNHKLDPIIERHCWAMLIDDVVEICQDNGHKNMTNMVSYHMDELFRFWPTTMNTYSVGIALELSTNLTDENFSKEQFDYVLRMSDIDLADMTKAFGDNQCWDIVVGDMINETKGVMDFILNGTIQKEE